MAHHRFDVLEELLKDLDDERNDIFLHIDKKTKVFDEAKLKAAVKKGQIYFVPRIKVYWGDFSQIKCVVKMLKYSISKGFHDYYHLLVGVEYPIKSQEYIHHFIKANYGKEFIGFDIPDFQNYIDRIKYFHFASKYARNENKFAIYFKTFADILLQLQKRLRVNRLKREESYYRKGYANWSITHGLASYIIKEFPKIKKQYKWSICGDEIIFHTIVYNSRFYANVYDVRNEYKSAMRLTSWTRKGNQMIMDDLEMLLKSDKLFARKFDTEDAVELVQKIREKRL